MSSATVRPWRLAPGATGVVSGDPGTSPLYAFRESFIAQHRPALDEAHVLGVLSMLIWALVRVVTVKYGMDHRAGRPPRRASPACKVRPSI